MREIEAHTHTDIHTEAKPPDPAPADRASELEQAEHANAQSGPADAQPGAADAPAGHADAQPGAADAPAGAARTGEALVRLIRDAAARIAQSQAEFLALLDEIEESGAWEGWVGVRSLPHWVSHVCEMSPHTAREYIRVMRGLRLLPTVAQRFAAGQVSYSKVREITRLAGHIDPAEAEKMCRYAAAAQLSRMVSTYRRISPTEDTPPHDLPKDIFRIQPMENARTRITLELPEAEAAELLALVDAAVDEQIRSQQQADREQPGTPAPGDKQPRGSEQAADARQEAGEVEPPVSRVDRLLQLLRLGSRTSAASGGTARRAELYVHVSADTVAAADPSPSLDSSALMPTTGAHNNGASDDSDTDTDKASADAQSPAAADHAIAGDQIPPIAGAGIGHIEGFGPVTAETISRLACESPLVGTLIDNAGDVLALGRSRRLASRRQRRALAARDIGCQFPGCTRTRLLEAHHIRPWAEGGPTNMDNMLLLCRSHHIAVHEHHVTITRSTSPFTGALKATSGFEFTTQDGVHLLPAADPARAVRVFDTATIDPGPASGTGTPDGFNDPDAGVGSADELDPERIATVGGGEGFDLHECVRWLFDAASLLKNRTGPDQDKNKDKESKGRAA